MQHIHAPKPLIAFLAAAIVGLPVFAVPVGASPASAVLDDEVSQRLQTSDASVRIPVIVEGSAQGDGAGRAQRAENRVRSGGGLVVGSSSLLGASVAELTPAEIGVLAADPWVGRIHIDAEVKATGVAEAEPSVGGLTPIVFQQTVGATEAWKEGFTGRGVTVAVLDTGIGAAVQGACSGTISAGITFFRITSSGIRSSGTGPSTTRLQGCPRQT